MKELIFKSGKAVGFFECYSQREPVLGVQREVLDFRFDTASNTLDGVDAMFTADECDELIIRETKTVKEQKVDEAGNLVTEEIQVLDEDGNPVLDETGNPIVDIVPVMVDVERMEEYTYHNFSIRAALSKQFFTLATVNGVEDVEQISVKMAQKTETEIKLAAVQSQITGTITEAELDNAYMEGVNSL